MAVNVQDGSLVWQARIDDSKIPGDIQALQELFAELNVEFVSPEATAQSLQKVKESVIASQKEIFNITEATDLKINQDQVANAQLTQEKITDIVIEESHQREMASRLEAEAFLKANLPGQRVGIPTGGLPGKAGPQVTSIENVIGKDVAKQLSEAEGMFLLLDQTAQDFVKEMVELELQLARVELAQKKLNEANDEGTITTKQYIKGTEALTAQQNQISESITLLNKRQKELNASTANDISSISAKKVALKQLKDQYDQLTISERESIVGQKLAANIRGVTLELEKLKRAGTAGFDELGNAIKRQVGLLEKLQRQAAIYKQGIQQATLPANIAKYNQKLQETNIQITKLANAGKKGFDSLGNSTENLAKKTNILSKGFSFFRQAAFLIPGIGIAGIFNLIGEGVAALVESLFKGNDALDTFKQNWKNINDVVREANKEAGKQITDLKLLYAAATNVNLSLKERHAAVDALQKQFPEYFGNIKDETILNGGAKDAYDQLTASIISSSRARAALIKLQDLESQKLDIAFKKQEIQREADEKREKIKNKTGDRVTATDEFGNVVATTTAQERRLDIDRQRRKDVRDEELKEISIDQQQQFLITQLGQQKITQAVIDEHKGREAKVKKISDTSERELIALLQKRKKLIEDIQNIERDAKQSGLVKEASEIDKINERREKEIQLLNDANILIQKFNDQKKNKTKVALIGQDEIDRINKAADIIIQNTIYKQDAEKYLEAVKLKEAAFNELQKAQETGNKLLLDQAKETYKEEVGDFSSMVEFLSDEYDRLFANLNFDGTDDIGAVTAFNGIVELLKKARKKADDDEKQRRDKNFADLVQQTITFKDKELEINKKFNDLEATLEKEKGRFSPDQFEDRRKAIEDAKKQELTDLENDIVRQSALYKKLNQDIIRFSKKNLKDAIADFKKILTESTNLTPQMRADIQSTIDKYQGLLDSTNKASKKFLEIGKDILSVGNDFSSLGTALEGVNDDVADLLNSLADVANIAGNAVTAIGQFASGDIFGGISSTVNAITGVFNIGKKAKESRKQAEKELQEFNQNILAGEIDITQEYRNRQREQEKLNKLKLDGLQSEKKLLEEQKKAILDQYQQILNQLNNESFVSDLVTKKFGGVLGIGRKTKTVEIRQTLNGLSFEEMEKLFSEGRLTGRAKELFEILQKIKQEGADIDALLAENAEAAKEIFTGTTGDNIVDAIAEGFASGEKSAADFADNFQDLMRAAIIQSLKFKFLEGPLKQFFEDFAAASESDGQLTSEEIDRLKTLYNTIITNAADQFDQLQKIAGINFQTPGGGGSGNTLQGAIKGITEQQAELLAGQFGGLRITNIEQLKIATTSLSSLQQIQVNTATLHDILKLWKRLETNGLKAL